MRFAPNIQNYGSSMQILIPMTGHGSRFVAEGYRRLKPFIKIHNTPMVEWVIKMFPGDHKNITFICREEHLRKNKYISKELKRIAPESNIFSVKNWKKRGPVSDVLRASEIIQDDKPVLVSYCDFFADWEYKKFLNYIKTHDPDGAIPCYTGFHPHLIYANNIYATCEVNSKNRLIKIREKFQLNDDKFMDLQSPGLYYFKSGILLKKYCKKLMKKKNTSINGEYYMSLPFNEMVSDNCKIMCPPLVKHFCQWGTPRDLEEYNFWMSCIEKLNSQKL